MNKSIAQGLDTFCVSWPSRLSTLFCFMFCGFRKRSGHL